MRPAFKRLDLRKLLMAAAVRLARAQAGGSWEELERTLACNAPLVENRQVGIAELVRGRG